MGTGNAAKRSDQAFEVSCPDCGGVLKVDPVTQSVISHTPAPRKRTFEDLGAAARALKEQESRRDSLFAQSVQAEKHRDDLLDKRFAEALKKAKETPLTEKPLREFDLD
jgi:acyl-CoA reductase-like NAD-dependent aldehyde dehydrogenase